MEYDYLSIADLYLSAANRISDLLDEMLKAEESFSWDLYYCYHRSYMDLLDTWNKFFDL